VAELRRLSVNDQHAIGYAPGVAMYVWRGQTSMEGARSTAAAMRATREVTPDERGVLLGLVEAGAPAPASDVRKALADAMREADGFVRASALIFEGQGFQASIVRMVATGLALIARPSFPHHVFGELAEAIAWLQPRCEPPSTAANLQAMITELREG